MQETYRYNIKDFDRNGMNQMNGRSILRFIREWEHDFFNQFYPFKATHLFSNQRTMFLIDQRLDLEGNEKCGMELVDGEIDFDTHLKIEEHSQYPTIYAISSGIKGNEDEPLNLIIDADAADGIVLLKYIKDDDYNEVEEAPTDVNKKVKVCF